MPVRNPTRWANKGIGSITPSSGAEITSQSGISLSTQSGVTLTVNDDVYSPPAPAAWTLTPKNTDQWTPPSGEGYVIQVGSEDLTTNLGEFLVTNAGDNIVTTPTYNVNKYPTEWTESGV